MHPFLLTNGEAFGRPVCRLGMASYGNTSITPDDLQRALDRGINFLNWQGLAEGPSSGDAFNSLVASLGNERPRVVVCAQFGARRGKDAAVELRSALASLGTSYIDVLTLYYVERREEWEEITSRVGALAYLRDAQRDGVVRRIAITSHQRRLAAEIARTGLLDVLMIRYNAAHRGAERDVFPTAQSLRLPMLPFRSAASGCECHASSAYDESKTR